MNRWLRLCSWCLALLMMLVPTRFDLVSAAVMNTAPRQTAAQRMGFSSAQPYMSVMLQETAGRTDVLLDKAQALEGEAGVVIVIPTTATLGSVTLRLDQSGNVVERMSVSVAETETTATMTVVQNRQTTLNATVDKKTNAITEGWRLEDGKKIDLAGWTRPAPEKGDGGQRICGVWEWLSCWNDCLASMGVAAWIVTLLTLACAGKCSQRGYMTCLLCMSAGALIAASIIGACVRTCNSYIW